MKIPIYLSLLSIGASTLVSATERVRNYDHKKDYDAVMALCMQSAEDLIEDDCCSCDMHTFVIATKDINYLGAEVWVKVIEKDNKVIGFALYNHSSSKFGIAFLGAVVIDQEWQRNGYGTQIFASIKNDLKKFGYGTLWSKITKNNQNAIAWHKKQGFVQVTKSSDLELPEQTRITSELSGQVLYELKLQSDGKSSPTKVTTVSKQDKQRFIDEKKREVNRSFFTDRLNREITKKFTDTFSHNSPLDRCLLSRIIMTYLRDRSKIEQFASYILKTETLEPKIESHLSEIFEFIDDNLESVGLAAMSELADNHYVEMDTFECTDARCLDH